MSDEELRQAKVTGMKKVLSNAESKAELEQLSLMYVFDASYERADICQVLKEIEIERGWR